MLKVKEAAELLIQYRETICRIIFAGYMIALSIMDIRWKKVRIEFLLAGIFPAAAGVLCAGKFSAILTAGGIAVGIIFLIISRITREAFGYGDSILIVIMGGMIGFWNILSILMAAFLMASGYSAFLLIVRKFSRKSSFPFIPFLTVSYIGGMICGM